MNRLNRKIWLQRPSSEVTQFLFDISLPCGHPTHIRLAVSLKIVNKLRVHCNVTRFISTTEGNMLNTPSTTSDKVASHSSLLEYSLPDVHLLLHIGVFELLQSVLVPPKGNATLRARGSGAREHSIHTGITSEASHEE